MLKTFTEYLEEADVKASKVVTAFDGKNHIPYGIFAMSKSGKSVTMAPVKADGSRMTGAFGLPKTYKITNDGGKRQAHPNRSVVVDLDTVFVKEAAHTLKPVIANAGGAKELESQNKVPYSTGASDIKPTKDKTNGIGKPLDPAAGALKASSPKTENPDGKAYSPKAKL